MDYIIDSQDKKPKKANPTEINMSVIDDSQIFDKTVLINPYSNGTNPTVTTSQRLIPNSLPGGGITEKIIMPENLEKAAINYSRDNNHKVEFLVDESDSPNCIIAELKFPSVGIRDYVFDDDDIVKFAKKINKKNTDFILNKEKEGEYTIKYTLATESNQKYILDIDSSKIASEFFVKVYEETYVYAPHGGITFGKWVFVNNAVTYTDYKAVYIDETTLKNISCYDSVLDSVQDLGRVNSMTADGIMYSMNHSDFEKYKNLNELMSSVSSAATFASVPLILVCLSNATGWTILGISLTLAGAGSTAYCSFNNITNESLEDDLEDILNDGNFNVCLACYDLDVKGAFSFFNAEWNSWDGKYINRIIGDSVLNVGVNLKLYDVNNKQILDFDSIN